MTDDSGNLDNAFTCNCDPLYVLIESVVHGMLQERALRFSAASAADLESALSKIRHHKSKAIHHSLPESPEDSHEQLKICEPLSVYTERCVKTYISNLLRPSSSSNGKISCTFTWQQLTFFLDIWRDLIKESHLESTFPQIDESGDYFMDVHTLQVKPEALQELCLPKKKYEPLRIFLNPTFVATQSITWILNNFPRNSVNSQSCRIENYKVNIGAVEINEPKGIIPIRQHRKFLIAKFIAKALGKSGYSIDQDEYFALPNESALLHDIFIVGEDRCGENPSSIRVNVGKVYVKESNSNQTEFPDVTVEYFHNLRLQRVKMVTEEKEDKNKKDLSWMISASNLTAAVMNYDLLLKEAKTDMELLVIESEQKETSGMLFIMYNYSRVVSILQKFTDAVQKNEYTPLPPIETVDFSLLSSKEEVDLITLLWEWPRTLDKTVDFLELELNISANLRCIKELAGRLNNFYSINKVLMPTNSPHSFNIMYARIHLLLACRRVFEEFMELLEVEFYGDVDQNGQTVEN